MNAEIDETIKEIKRSFHLKMNGVASQSMREKGASYKINWGLSLAQLREIAEPYGKDYHLAIALWKEDVRECKILATLLMPPYEMLPEVAEVWMEQIKSQDLAEMISFNLFQYLDYAPVLAYEWIASDQLYHQICAYQIFSRLFMKGQAPNDRGINEFLDQVGIALQSENMGLKHATMNSVIHFTELGEEYKQIASKGLKMEF